jgi:hypothetical protein
MADAIISVAESGFGQVQKIKWTWTSAAAGTASLVTSRGYYGRVLALVTDPGATAPAADYDITVTDAEGYDVMQGTGANRHTTNTETAVPTTDSPAFGPLTINISNAGDAKVGVAVLYVLGIALGA